MFKGLPKRLIRICQLVSAIDFKEYHKLVQDIVYLWREFSIRVNIKPIIKKYIISFYYKENQLMHFETENLKDVFKVIEELKENRVD